MPRSPSSSSSRLLSRPAEPCRGAGLEHILDRLAGQQQLRVGPWQRRPGDVNDAECVSARERERAFRALLPCELAVRPQAKGATHERQRRTRVLLLCRDAQLAPPVGYGEPGIARREAVAVAAGPRERHAAAVASEPRAVRAVEDRVLPELVRELDLGEAELL